MRIACQTFALPKSGREFADCEDAYYPCNPNSLATYTEDQPDASSFRAAVCDGATDSLFSQMWAGLLAAGYGSGEWSEDVNEESLKRAQKVWKEFLDEQELPWFAEEKAKLGAFAAVAGMTIESNGTWKATAVGDSCLFQIRDGVMIESFPMKHSADFNNFPYLLGSLPERNGDVFEHKEVKMDGKWQAGDTFFLTSDAFGQWFLKTQESTKGAEAVEWLSQLENHNLFAQLVNAERQQPGPDGLARMKDDDVTFVRITIDGTGPKGRPKSRTTTELKKPQAVSVESAGASSATKKMDAFPGKEQAEVSNATVRLPPNQAPSPAGTVRLPPNPAGAAAPESAQSSRAAPESNRDAPISRVATTSGATTSRSEPPKSRSAGEAPVPASPTPAPPKPASPPPTAPAAWPSPPEPATTRSATGTPRQNSQGAKKSSLLIPMIGMIVILIGGIGAIVAPLLNRQQAKPAEPEPAATIGAPLEQPTTKEEEEQNHSFGQKKGRHGKTTDMSSLERAFQSAGEQNKRPPEMTRPPKASRPNEVERPHAEVPPTAPVRTVGAQPSEQSPAPEQDATAAAPSPTRMARPGHHRASEPEPQAAAAPSQAGAPQPEPAGSAAMPAPAPEAQNGSAAAPQTAPAIAPNAAPQPAPNAHAAAKPAHPPAPKKAAPKPPSAASMFEHALETHPQSSSEQHHSFADDQLKKTP